ncbi:lipoate--protein ligase family protein [Streptococcus zhangguiae]|uniref:Protein--protein lipoyl transferase n=1 Tax=Streptococcus zhangguiae TaxID=2664091 RepID=A0A6I4RQ69_9STRE|nr:protein--protein lipoyl transferase [Streptococcus sp. zg-70]MWV56245.1 protein--protein lipoyl transferase [Streptococcus sp. zg-70]
MKGVSLLLLQSLADVSHLVYHSSEAHFTASIDELILADVFLKEIDRQKGQLIWHLWPLERTVILGMADCRLPHFERGVELIRQHGYQPLVRSIGGLAVVADAGIVNLSLIIPDHLGGKKLDMGQAYQLMVVCLKEILPVAAHEVEVREISDSYCPGTYDLSIRGQKFAGLAQRRIKSGIAISAYISLSGKQEERGVLIREFYRVAAGDSVPQPTYPKVNPASMATLSDLLAQPVRMEDVMGGLHQLIQNLGQTPIDYRLSLENLADFAKGKRDAIERHQKVGIG